MAPNPLFPDPNKNISLPQVIHRCFDSTDDLWRVDVVKGNISIDPGDIEIGAVEIKDHNSETRLDVEAVSDYNAIMVRDVVEFQKAKVNVFGSTSITPAATVTLATYTVPAGKIFVLTGGIVGGRMHGEFEFEVGGSTVAVVRNSGSNPTIQVKFFEPPEASASTVINIKATNDGHQTRPFEATLSGYTINS
jgi:hypothetical protein